MSERIYMPDVGEELVKVECPCGAAFRLYFNGGELDCHVCRCGRVFQQRSRGYDVWLREPEPAR